MIVLNMTKEKIWGICQRDLIPTMRKTDGIYKSRILNMAFNQGGIPLLVKALSPQINKTCMHKIIILLTEYYENEHVTKHIIQRQTCEQNF